MKIISALFLIVFLAIFFAPWMPLDRSVGREEFMRRCSLQPQTYIYTWRPFGRWVKMCQGSWYTVFFGRVLFYGPNPLHE